MPLIPRCLACGKKATTYEYRPYCSAECNPDKKTNKPTNKED